MPPVAAPGLRPGSRRQDETGAAVAESSMVLALVVLLFAALLQAGIVIHTRNVMIDAASAGARYGALADRHPGDGVERAREVLAASAPGQSGAAITAETTSQGGVPIVRVTVSSSLPGVGFLPGPVPLTVSGHAYRH
ncbi:pilus assembly protein [Micrococcus sp. EYE_162]|uniref:TadE/TadG family type IV pilus assembly protein n=1 Tax=unclassified Micrococcus TaxID=2620948 RepID=UPI00249ED568|nr:MULTISPECIES: TadE/TadG family type IV pilus assembly protein [unclassified Micrococcus]MCK6094502.1 pilus assembly protein [Micrococcus sp. EYE_212]MCK6170683.1 pilus assembly protein [Micrococcus sp. EYE_162]